MARRSLLSNPLIIGSAIALLLAGRWIRVAGLGDYGWDYEVASRILHGQVFFRDFLLLRGPLSNYALAGWMRVLGTGLFVDHLHVWFSYALCLGVGLLLVRELSAPRSAQIAGVSLAAVMACPVFTWGHALNYQAPALAGAAILCARYSQRKRHWWAALSGAAAALSILEKQNVGVAIAFLVPLFLGKKRLGIYLAGFAPVFLMIFGYFSAEAGAGEVWRQLFTDAASTKGRWFVLAARAVPRIILRPALPGRRWWELAASGAAYALLLVLLVRTGRQPSAGDEDERSNTRMGVACLAAAGAAIVFSLLRLNLEVAPGGIVEPWPLLLQLTYMLFFLLCLAHFLRDHKPGLNMVVFLVLAITAAQEASNPNLAYSAPLVIPLACALLSRLHMALRPRAAGAAVAAVYLLGTISTNPPAHAYEPTYELPAGSPFAGLRAPGAYAAIIHETWEHVRPLVRDRQALWLLNGGGPYLAYGGLPVFNAPYYMPDSFPVRRDREMIQRWQKDPPDVVVLSDGFQASPRSQVLTAEYIKKHVLSDYVEVWHSIPGPGLEVWQRKAARAVAPP